MKEIVAVYDMDAKYYQDPRYVTNLGEAVRSFINILEDEDSPMAKHPESYCLFHVGTYDPQTGNINPCDPRKIIGLWEAAKPKELDS